MSRPTRLRRPPAKYVKEDNPPEVNPKAQKDSKKVKNDPLNALRSPILRDRTNLTIELVKVDNLLKNNDKDQLKMPEEVKDKRGMRTRAQDIKKSAKSQEKTEINPEEKKTTVKKSRNSQEKITKNPEEKTEIKDPIIKKSANSQGKIAKNPEEKVTIKKKTSKKSANSHEKIMKIPEEKEAIKKTIIKKSANSQEEISKNPEEKKAMKKIIKRQIPSRSAKKPEIQMIEEEPKETPDIEKPSKVTRSSKIPRKTSKSASTPSESLSKPISTSSKRLKSSQPSVVINKPPKTSPKPKKRVSRHSPPKSTVKSPKKLDKKFFKARKNITLTHSKISPMKRGIRAPKPSKSKRSPSIYQPTLKESFARAKKSLRPRKIDKNYNEESKIDDKSKGPVYKNLKIGEDSPKDKNKVYEFSFDVNDSNERFRKKRKKKTVRKAPAKRAKIAKEPVPIPETNHKKPEAPAEVPESPKEKSKPNTERPKLIFDRIDEVDENFNENEEINDKLEIKNSEMSQEQVHESIRVVVDVHEAPASPASPNIDDPEAQISTKPKIISNTRLEGAKRISLTSTPLNSEIKSRVCPSTFSNRPSSQYRTMLNHSLIRRSFSPIVREQEKFDASSPWRPVVISSGFSRVKNIFQSTPQGRRLMTPHGINSLTTDNKGATNKINKIVEINESSVVVDNNSATKSPRKFGTVLSNVSSSPSKSPTMFRGFDNSRNKMSQGKENADENSPVKSPVKKIKGLRENLDFEAKPGPSGLQKNGAILRQSNLNNFLNIQRMPESTSIVTAHGIFDDNQATTISGRQRKNFGDFSVGNAFGFDEESTFEDFSGVERETAAHVEKVKVVKVLKKVEPTRLPVLKTVESREEVENGEKIEVLKEKKHAEATKSDVVEAVHFLDTFDAEERETSPVEVPLFVDPEPVHFVQPPRYSYSKRKRAVKFNTSDETEHSEAFDSDDDENHVKHKNKKRKMTKAQREQQKKLDDWAKSVNQTFDEIEHFDLLVE